MGTSVEWHPRTCTGPAQRNQLRPVTDHFKRILRQPARVSLRYETVVHETNRGSLIVILRHERVDCIDVLKEVHVRREC